ncbi:MAG: pilus assembly protein TadG-related protein [Candidatus Sulfotelmatobacter sp.]
MLPPLIRRRRRHAEPRSKERGFTMALVAMSIVMIISMAALSIDIGTLYEAKTEAQRAADAAALTAARVVSISGATGSNGTNWVQICGGATSTATQAATSMAQNQQNFIGGIAAGTVTVKYGAGSAGATNTSCNGIADFAVNPVVTVTVQRTNLPVFFARIFSLFGSRYTGTTVSATATAEAFNPSGSNPMVPVNPRCVKPWMVPNQDPGNAAKPFVNETTGALQNAGVATAGVIGETFSLVDDCNASARRGRTPRTCAVSNAPQATPGANPTLDYLPGQVLSAPIAIAANGGIGACSDATNNDYSEAVAGCDQTTAYQCGVIGGSNPNMVNLAEDPGPSRNDSVNGAECLINAGGDGLGNGQDSLNPGASPYSYPFQIQAGSGSPQVALGNVPNGSQITSSPSIVSLPIYDSAAVTNFNVGGTTVVTVIGFLQVFINSANSTNGEINVTVMNVAGCGNNASSSPVTGTSPVPIRLITPP